LNPTVSIVYLTKNGGQILRKSLEAVFFQNVDFEFEVIAVDSGSTDNTLEVLKSFPVKIYQIPPEEFNFGLTRDFGFSLAKGDLLITISQDAVPVGTNWLENIVSCFGDASIAVVQGKDILPNNEDLFYWDKVGLFYFTRDSENWIKTHDNIWVSFTSCAIRRQVWEENPLGRVEMSEDKVFQKQIMEKGYKIFFQRKAMVYHSHTYDVKTLAKRCENEGLGWRIAGHEYTFLDMIKDLLKFKTIFFLFYGLITFKIKRLSELLFILIRPIFVFKGNHFTKHYVR